jgi:hypothetical protein
MKSLARNLTFFPQDDDARQWSGHVKGSPSKYQTEDGEAIAAANRDAAAHPVSRPVDARQLSNPIQRGDHEYIVEHRCPLAQRPVNRRGFRG